MTVQNWMLWNKLKPNPSKTEFLLIGHEQQCKQYLSIFPCPLRRTCNHHNWQRTLVSSLTRISHFGHRSLRPAGHVFTTSGNMLVRIVQVPSKSPHRGLFELLQFSLPWSSGQALQATSASSKYFDTACAQETSWPLAFPVSSLHWIPVKFQNLV